MTDEAVDKARKQLVRTISRTSVGDADWTIGDIDAELIAEKIEALIGDIDAELIAEKIEALIDAKLAPAVAAGQLLKFAPAPDQNGKFANVTVPAVPSGFTPAVSVMSRGQLPPDLAHDTWVEVAYRDGLTSKAAGTGLRVMRGEASLFNWKHASMGKVIVNVAAEGEAPRGEPRPGMVGNPDDDIIGYRLIPAPANEMSFKAKAS